MRYRNIIYISIIAVLLTSITGIHPNSGTTGQIIVKQGDSPSTFGQTADLCYGTILKVKSSSVDTATPEANYPRYKDVEDAATVWLCYDDYSCDIPNGVGN